MYKKGLSLLEGWLRYHYPKYYEEVESQIIHEIINVLVETSEKARTINVADNEWVNNLLELVKAESEARGIHVLRMRFKLFIKHIVKDRVRRERLQELVRHILENKSSFNTTHILTLTLLEFLDLEVNG